MKIRKAVITAAGRRQRPLPLQTLVDRDGVREDRALRILVEEALDAGVEEIGVVVAPGDQAAYRAPPATHAAGCTSSSRPAPAATATPSAAPATSPPASRSCTWSATTSTSARTAPAAPGSWSTGAEAEDCAVSAVQATREHLLPYYGTVGGRRVPRRSATSTRSTTVAREADPDRGRAAPGRARPAGRALPLLLRHARADAGRLGPARRELVARRPARRAGARRTLLARRLGRAGRPREQYLALEVRGPPLQHRRQVRPARRPARPGARRRRTATRSWPSWSSCSPSARPRPRPAGTQRR